MKIIIGNLWDELGVADIIFVTTNAQLRADGALVMGRGAAKEAIERFPQLPFNLGKKIPGAMKNRGAYGLVADPESTAGKTRIGAFQVKHHWRDEAELLLIKFSTGCLKRWAERYAEKRFALNFPGIGNGRLKEEDVLPLLATLPDNVFIYKLPPT